MYYNIIYNYTLYIYTLYIYIYIHISSGRDSSGRLVPSMHVQDGTQWPARATMVCYCIVHYSMIYYRI